MPGKSTVNGRLAFLVPHQGRPFEGCVRPFVNWARELSSRGQKTVFILHRCERSLAAELSGIANVEVMESDSEAGTKRNLESAAPSVLLTDDSSPALRMLERIGMDGRVPICIYAQILFGFHSIAEVFHTKSIDLRYRFGLEAVKMAPFNLLKQGYTRSLIKPGRFIITNSNTTANLLQVMYGLEPDGVAYPPVDRSVFRPMPGKRKNQALLYLGSHAGDTDTVLAERICRALARKGLDTLVFGNRKLASKLNGSGLVIKDIGGASDVELARAYSESLLTICPQKWEPFGYVTAESISCGTPPLVFNCMGNAESVRMSGCGTLANRTEDMLEALEQAGDGPDEESCGKGPFRFDSRASADDLMALINKRIIKSDGRR